MISAACDVFMFSAARQGKKGRFPKRDGESELNTDWPDFSNMCWFPRYMQLKLSVRAFFFWTLNCP